MKIKILGGILLTTVSLYSQVGINTKNPKAILHVDGKSTTASTNPDSGAVSALQQSDDFVVTATGSVGIGTAVPHTSSMLDIDVSSLLSGNKKGFLGPRVALLSLTDVVTIPNPATGLLVYNLGTDANFKYEGYVYWNGFQWRALSTVSLALGSIDTINCNSIKLEPSTYVAGISYTGTMSVSYIGGNGGTYQAQTIGPINGLTATLSSGNFSNGSGTLYYTITGTPTVTSPTSTTFPITIGGKTCDAIIGSGDGIAPGDLVYYRSGPIPASVGAGGIYGNAASSWMNYYQSDLPIIGGKLRLDGYFNSPVAGSGTVAFNPRLVNVSNSSVKFSFSELSSVNNYNTSNLVLAPNNWVNLDDGVFNGVGANSTLTSPTATSIAAAAPNGAGVATVGQDSTEVITVDISVDDKWYRIYYFPVVENMNTTSLADDVRRVFLSIQRLY